MAVKATPTPCSVPFIQEGLGAASQTFERPRRPPTPGANAHARAFARLPLLREGLGEGRLQRATKEAVDARSKISERP